MSWPEYEKIKKDLTELSRQLDRIEGQLQEVMRQIQSEFSCVDEAQARALLEQLKKDCERADKTAQKEAQKFNEKWSDKLGELA